MTHFSGIEWPLSPLLFGVSGYVRVSRSASHTELLLVAGGQTSQSDWRRMTFVIEGPRSQSENDELVEVIISAAKEVEQEAEEKKRLQQMETTGEDKEEEKDKVAEMINRFLNRLRIVRLDTIPSQLSRAGRRWVHRQKAQEGHNTQELPYRPQHATSYPSATSHGRSSSGSQQAAGPQPAFSDPHSTERQRLYEQYLSGPDKSALSTELIRCRPLSHPNLTEQWRIDNEVARTDQTLQRAHSLDLELITTALSHIPGPKLSLDYLDAIADVARQPDNWRYLTGPHNREEQELVQQGIEHAQTGQPLYLAGH